MPMMMRSRDSSMDRLLPGEGLRKRSSDSPSPSPSDRGFAPKLGLSSSYRTCPWSCRCACQRLRTSNLVSQLHAAPWLSFHWMAATAVQVWDSQYDRCQTSSAHGVALEEQHVKAGYCAGDVAGEPLGDRTGLTQPGGGERLALPADAGTPTSPERT